MVFLNAKGTPLTSRGVRYVLNEAEQKYRDGSKLTCTYITTTNLPEGFTI